jgi:hypothetical protein
MATRSIHSRNDQIFLEFGLKKPAFRIVVNTPTTHGSMGLTTGLDPAMTLGCGGYGGNITSDNISPKHLLNIKRLACETSPAVDTHARPGTARVATAPDPGLPKVAAPTGWSTRPSCADRWRRCSGPDNGTLSQTIRRPPSSAVW